MKQLLDSYPIFFGGSADFLEDLAFCNNAVSLAKIMLAKRLVIL